MELTIPEIPDTAPFPKFTRPEIIGCFSVDSDRNYIDGAKNLKFIKMPKNLHVSFDLDEVNRISPKNNIDEAEAEKKELKHAEETSQLRHLIIWIQRHEQLFQDRRPDFVFYRGLMKKILCTPYEERDGWFIAACRKNNTIYLRSIETPESIQQRKKMSRNSYLKKVCSWGYNFENFLLLDTPESEPNPMTVDKEECNLMYLSKLGSHKIMYGAEIDGILVNEGDKESPEKLIKTVKEEQAVRILESSAEIIELKTTREWPKGDMTYNYRRFNLRNFWTQSFPARVSSVLVGIRDDQGIVHKLDVMHLKAIPKMGKDWCPTVCFNFLNQFLNEVKKVSQTASDDSTVFTFDFKPSARPKSRSGVKITITSEPNSAKYLPNLI